MDRAAAANSPSVAAGVLPITMTHSVAAIAALMTCSGWTVTRMRPFMSDATASASPPDAGIRWCASSTMIQCGRP